MSVFLDSFAQALEALPAREASSLGASRRDALDAALRDGLPTARAEAWRYTPLRAFERRAYMLPTAVEFDAAVLDSIPTPRIVFANGRLVSAATDLSGLPAGVTVEPLSKTLEAGDPTVAATLSRRFDRPDQVFARLNAALADEGAVIRVAAGVEVARTLHIVVLGVPDGADRAWHLRHVVELGEGAHLQLVEHQLGAGEHRNLGNSIADIRLGANAQLRHARVQDEATGAAVFARTDAALSADATYRRLDLELGAALSRHELNVALHGERARVHANGVLLATGRRHLDTRLGIDHAGRDSGCELTWRGIGADRGRAVFHGGILIREGADGTLAALSNKNLLLGEGAEIDTQPVLEIHADEVQAAHGATVGQLDPTALFYLRSRGLPMQRARELLTAAFCRQTLDVFEDAALRELLATRLDAALARLEIA